MLFNHVKIVGHSIGIVLIFSVFFSLAIAEDYKIGVVYSVYDGKQPKDRTTIKTELIEIKQSIGKGHSYIRNCNNSVQLVVQAEIVWGWTGKDTESSGYNLDAFKIFAEVCKEESIKWTPLLSYHYDPPCWLIGKYSQDPRMKHYDGHITMRDIGPGHFMPYSPSSPVWKTEASYWTEIVLQQLQKYMREDGFRVIDEILLGNEMAYENADTSYDEYSNENWKKWKAENSPNSSDKLSPEIDKDIFNRFRVSEWEDALTVVLEKGRDTLDSFGLNSIKVSTKFSTYMLADPVKSSIHGVSLEGAKRIIDNSGIDFVGVDEYPPDLDLYSKWRDKTSLPLYLTEFNQEKQPLENLKDELKKAKDFGISYFCMFSWAEKRVDIEKILPEFIEEITSPSFSDISTEYPDYTTYIAISELCEMGIIEGYSDGTFRPDSPINRAEFLKILTLTAAKSSNQSLLKKVRTYPENKFPDVASGEWYETPIKEAFEARIIDGYPDGLFRPGKTINMAEMLKMIVLTFTDEKCDESVNPWFDDYLKKSKDKIKPIWVEKNTFKSVEYLNAGKEVTRGIAAKAIYDAYLAYIK